MSDQSDTFGVGSVLIHVALHGFPGMTVKDDDPLYQMMRTGLKKYGTLHEFACTCDVAVASICNVINTSIIVYQAQADGTFRRFTIHQDTQALLPNIRSIL